MAKLKLGDYNTLEISRKSDPGIYLLHEEGEVLLPNKFVTPEMEVGKEVEVFIMHDSLGRLVATTQRPVAKVGEFAVLEVQHVIDGGAFLAWGVDKDLFAPTYDQHRPMEVGERYVVRIMVHPKSGKLVGIGKIGAYLHKAYLEDFKENQELDALVYDKTDLGYACVVDGAYSGIIYENEVFNPLEIGQEVKVYLKNIRDDNKMDLSIRALGYDGILGEEKVILDKLQASTDGFLPFHDKSDPEAIKKEFKMSKKSFKKLIGLLYKKKVIEIEKQGIRLVK